MNSRPIRSENKAERGQSLVEFALSTLVLITLLLGVVEIGRMILVYTTVANATRAGVRYAIVHGFNNPATVPVETVVTNFLSAAPMNTGAVTPTVACSIDGSTYSTCAALNSNTKPGCRVKVSVNYTYDPFLRYFPWPSINLGSTSRGVITF